MLRDAWRLALGTLTALPVAPPRTVDRRRAGTAMLLAPVAALPLGIAMAAVMMLGHGLELPTLVTALLALGAVILGNRAFHLDGLSDVADGLAASYDRQRSLAVMKTGTSGPAGVVATILVIGLQAAALTSLIARDDWWQVAVVTGGLVCCSRAVLTICCTRGVLAARSDGLGLAYTQSVALPATAVVWVAVAALLSAACEWIGLDWWRGLVAAAVAVGVVLVVMGRAIGRFGGVTGDVFGACVELALAAMLVVLS